jgi:hypothetical protein
VKITRIDPKQSYGFQAVIMRHCDLVSLNEVGVAWDPAKDKPGESECFVWNDEVIREVRGPYKKSQKRGRKSQSQSDNYNVVVTKRRRRNVKREDSS